MKLPILKKGDYDPEKLLLRDAPADDRAAEETVRAILDDVRDHGDEAVRRYSERFDRLPADLPLRVADAEIDEAYDSLEPAFLATLHTAAERIREFHSHQLRPGFTVQDGGAVLGQRFTPIAKVGLYVPGGTAAYPSTVLMNAVPARLAGVERLVMTTPPGPGGKVNPAILAAARVAGVREIYRVGGAQAIAALAYGTESIPAVDKIVGPGNLYVATAKRLVSGRVGIDMIAGPSEILIISDEKTDPVCLAADLLSQAEHDKNAAAALLCTDAALAERVAGELERQAALLPRREIAEASLCSNGKLIVVGSLDEAAEIADRLAPEHLELCVDDPFGLMGRIRNAGSIFLGRYTPEALGDYMAGPNHTLPTGGTARFAGPLSVDDFVKRSSYICFDAASSAALAEPVAQFARREGLEAHARSMESRR